MTVAAILLFGLVGWLAIAGLLSLGLGRAIRLADDNTPTPPPGSRTGSTTTPLTRHAQWGTPP